MYMAMLGLDALLMILAMILRRNRYNLSLLKAIILVVCGIIFAIGGAKLLHTFENWELVTSHKFTFSGFSFFGAVFGVFAFIPIVALILKIKVKDALDACSVMIAIGVGIIRIGCYFNGCCGSKVFYHADGNSFRIPVQLFEFALDMVIGYFLLTFEKKKLFKGYLYPMFLASYGFIRFFLEFLRDNEVLILGLTNGQVFSIAAIAIGLAIILPNIKKILEANKIAKEEYVNNQKLIKYRKANRLSCGKED